MTRSCLDNLLLSYIELNMAKNIKINYVIKKKDNNSLIIIQLVFAISIS